MIYFYDFSVPVLTARTLAINTDPRTADSVGYVIKSAFAEAYGHKVIRPWRRLYTQDGVHRIIGIVEDPKAVKANDRSRKLGIVAERLEYEFPQDEVVRLDILVTPVKHVPIRLPDGGVRHTYPSVAVQRVLHNDPDREPEYVVPKDPKQRNLLYSRWLFEQFSSERTGLRMTDLPQILSTKPAVEPMKLRGEVKYTHIPTMQAEVDVLVEDRDAAMAFLRQGLKKRKDLGLGGIFPKDAVREVLGT